MILLKNALAVDFDFPSVKRGVDILIEGDRIADVGKNIAAQNHDTRIIDLAGNMVSPGLVCSHNHFYSALARGITADIRPSTDFVSVLRNLWWRLDRAIDEEILYYSGLVGALEALMAGTTAVIDHHASPSFIKGSLWVLKNTFEKTGLRGVLCYEVTDRNGKTGMREGVEENVSFAKEIAREREAGKKSPLVEAAVGAHAPFTLGDEALGLLGEAVSSTGRGLHIHTAEDRYDSSCSHHLYGEDITERLAAFNLLNKKTICVHGVHLTEGDICRLNSYDSFLVHNARSNMNNTVGYALKLSEVGNVALGTDGIGSDMFEEMKFAYFKNRDAGGGYWPADFLHLLHNGNTLLERYFKRKFGRIERGFTADLVLYEYRAPTPLEDDNIAGHMVFGPGSRDVKTVIVNGRIVYENRRFPFDLQPVYEKAREAARRLWQRMDAIE